MRIEKDIGQIGPQLRDPTMEDVLVPIALFTLIGVIVGLTLYYRHRSRTELQTTIRSVVERGEALSPGLLTTLTASLQPPFADLRKGIVLIALGAGFLVFALVLNEAGAVRPLIAISAFPFALGLAYLGLWFGLKRNQ